MRGGRESRRAARAIVVTGGIGSGKSAFCARLASRPGVRLLSADAIVHRLLAQDPAVRAEVLEAFGPGVLDASGAIDRPRLAALAFPDSGGRRRLEAILHPRVRAALAAEVGRLKADPGAVMVLVEIPLLLEAGIPDWCDWVVALDAPREVRLARLAARGMPAEEAERRMASQGDDAALGELADERLVNDGDLDALDRLADAWWRAQGPGRE